jgi:MYXO-CTERM domain-containing protein
MPDASILSSATGDRAGYLISAGRADPAPLTHAMQIGDAGVASLDGMVMPAVRPALAFRVARRIEPDMDLADAEPAIAAVAPAVELRDGEIVRGFAVGQWRAVADHLAELVVELSLDDEASGTGQSAAGALALVLAGIAALQRRGEVVESGAMLVIAWPEAPGRAVRPGMTVLARTEHIGQVSFFTRD